MPGAQLLPAVAKLPAPLLDSQHLGASIRYLHNCGRGALAWAAGRLLTCWRGAGGRDHRKLGAELDLFSINDMGGAGLVFWHPKVRAAT